jgi:NAD dependent epimerase/dehydratase family enzyme
MGLGEMSQMILTGQRAVPVKLLESGFSFQFTDAEAALGDALASEE